MRQPVDDVNKPFEVFHQKPVSLPKRNPSRKHLEGFRQWEKETPRIERESSLGAVVGRLVDRMGYGARLSEQKAVEVWPEVVGETIAAVTKAISIKEGTLKVKVLNATWKNELFYDRDQIRSKLNRVLKRELVTEIKFL